LTHLGHVHIAIIHHRAAGYTPGRGGVENAGFIHMSIPHAAGSLYSTTGDLLRWEQGLFGGKLLSASSLAKMTTPFKNDYAFGLNVRTVSGRKVISHGGGIEGFNTFLAYHPEDKTAVIVLANLNGQAPDQIAEKLMSLAHGEKVQLASERKEVIVSPKVLTDYAGTYELQPGFDIVMTLEGNQLMTQATGQPKVPLFAESDTKFFLKVIDAQVEFFRNDKGVVTHLMLHQGGQDMKAPRK